MRQSLIDQFIQLLKCWLCDVQSGILVKKNWAHSVDQCQLQALQFWGDLIDLLSILLRCNGFTKIQKAIVHQISSRSPNSDHDHFLVQVWLWSVFSVQPLSWSSPVAVKNPLFITFHSPIEKWSLLCRIREDDTSKRFFFFNFRSAHEASTYQDFFSLLQMTNDHRMADFEFFSNFLSGCLRGSASTMALNRHQLPMAGHYTHLQGSLCKTSSTTTALYIP